MHATIVIRKAGMSAKPAPVTSFSKMNGEISSTPPIERSISALIITNTSPAPRIANGAK